ncbi:MAG: galactofuranosyltransferase [Bacteroidales bacterium]|nr:galactofuranosyltransferase [Bacteroidales bacterium]
MAYYFLSKNYKELNSAGNKAKTDIETILTSIGYKPSGFKPTNYRNEVVGFLITLLSVIKTIFRVSKNDVLVIQYPFKKYYTFVCKIVKWRGGKIITLIHDLGSFRRKKLSVEQEIRRLSNTNVLIAHNEKMKAWLIENGYTNPIVCLEIFDYLSSRTGDKQKKIDGKMNHVTYAGGLSSRKNDFIYKLDKVIASWTFILYGNGFDKTLIQNEKAYEYKGFMPSDELIEKVHADFGLVWNGDSIHTCSGNFGEYLRLNNPHKTSLYIRCFLPVIIWKEAALASFVSENKIGITVNSLDELNEIIDSISHEEYEAMRRNVIEISGRLAEGYYLKKAIRKAQEHL